MVIVDSVWWMDSKRVVFSLLYGESGVEVTLEVEMNSVHPVVEVDKYIERKKIETDRNRIHHHPTSI